ncbi:hypothetical protein ABZ816_26900 [Actinosynnema sp. NPDC047251]|uniref:Uncharacterized protein n=1 Tax=Saccharothrix espanaensis (strain ATCC 51144 / DSM 44229 / JCM 9112 / NBRC 15066 / NRRL 15764) TaxID=1179773 RepID=K0JVV1_SACES|nr:hypothetical protein [Saccharothrix espanaensis]CCH31980.1 hypothetical protein BN6_47010 [Saccharothrix espanaensis DSM 44229]
MADDSRGSVYADFMQDQLAAEETRKNSLEQRGLAVITSCGALAAFGVGALALFRQRDAIPLSAAAVCLLVGGAVTLVLGAIGGLGVNAPLRHRSANPLVLADTMREHWEDDDATARARVTATRARLLESLRRANDRRALVLLSAMTAEALGVAMLAATISVVAIGTL